MLTHIDTTVLGWGLLIASVLIIIGLFGRFIRRQYKQNRKSLTDAFNRDIADDVLDKPFFED